MKHWYQQPHPLIAGYTRTVLILDGSLEPVPTALPLVSNGMSALFCKTEKNEAGKEKIIQLSLCGKSIPQEFLPVDRNTTIIVYFFTPFALATLFNVAANKLNGQPINLDNWHAHKTNALRLQLVYASSIPQKIEVLDNLIQQQLLQNKRECEIIRFATDQIMYEPGAGILSEMLKKLHLTERTFQRLFKKYVGVTANQYRRICQFHLSFSQLRTNDFEKLSDIAYENGFTDQSHFIRSFKEFTQTTPNDYMRSGLKAKKK